MKKIVSEKKLIVRHNQKIAMSRLKSGKKKEIVHFLKQLMSKKKK